jgi:hypothetical protein
MSTPAAPIEQFAGNVQAYLDLYGGRDASALARNLSARIEAVDAGGIRLPVTVNDGEPDNAWVCSPRSTYIDYAAEEAHRLLPGAIGRPVAGLCRQLARLADACALDKAVALNNWCLSTNLYPPLAEVAIDQAIDQARQRWPQHALWFRSLNGHDNADWLDALQARGFVLIASRQVWLYPDLDAAARLPNMRADARLLQRQDLHWCGNHDISSEDAPRIAALYAQLYLGKYSRWNPDYRPQMIAQWQSSGLLRLEGWRDDAGKLQCIAGMFGTERHVSTPIVGYDTGAPLGQALYRTLTATSYRQARQSGRHLNLSAGAAGFKRLRGGQAAIEYSAVWAPRQARRTRALLRTLSLLTRHLGEPLMRHYRL